MLPSTLEYVLHYDYGHNEINVHQIFHSSLLKTPRKKNYNRVILQVDLFYGHIFPKPPYDFSPCKMQFILCASCPTFLDQYRILTHIM